MSHPVNISVVGHQGEGCLLLDPPIQYGQRHSYQTHCRENFASVTLCHLASTKEIFIPQPSPGGILCLRIYIIAM